MNQTLSCSSLHFYFNTRLKESQVFFSNSLENFFC
ncbi:MAG TPA: hypothetical protein [Caudoviricetes sp.]|nr:MAG TPA: hypothetical protein [Caudoviricetes sp.]